MSTMRSKICLPLVIVLLFSPCLAAQQVEQLPEAAARAVEETAGEAEQAVATHSEASADSPRGKPPKAVSVDLKEVFVPPPGADVFPQPPPETDEEPDEVPQTEAVEDVAAEPVRPLLSAQKVGSEANVSMQLLGVEIPPATSTRLVWKPSRSFSGMAVDTPVLVVNGAYAGPVLCLTAAIHGDELNGIEMIRRVMYDLDPHKLHGTVVGVPIVNLLGFSRNSRYLPDRRDLNRYFPGNPGGSVASRIAYAFFQDIVGHCNALVDLHTGSFYRTNIPQLRADLSSPMVAEFVELFGDIPVLNSPGNSRTLRAATVRAGIPAVTLEAGEPMRMQSEMVAVGVKTIRTLMAKNGMYSKLGLWVKPAPAFYRSAWIRVNASGILFSRMELGDEVDTGDILGAVNNPITNEQLDIVSPYKGRILGMALDQFVMPGFAVYHIGIHAAKGEKLPVDDSVVANGLPVDDALDSEEEKPPLVSEDEFDDE